MADQRPNDHLRALVVALVLAGCTLAIAVLFALLGRRP
jgi:hypothetical protein